MGTSDPKIKIIALINDYTLHKVLAKALLSNCPYHAFRHELLATIQLCDNKLAELYVNLESEEIKHVK